MFNNMTKPLTAMTVSAGAGSSKGAQPATPSSALGENSRLFQLLEQLDKLMSEKYAFEVFAKDTINFGVLATYRQTWEPQNYQVGDLVSTIPLAPKEIRRYTTRKVTRKTRAVKELEDALRTQRSESSETSRVDREIVRNAQTKDSFSATAHESYGGENTFKIDATETITKDQAKQSQEVKKDFRERVMKSAQEYRQQHRTEIDTSESVETEDTTFHEIQNPNDELAVTYLLYELQRTYLISEKIHRLTPVILVANDVPAPHEIDDAWLIHYDWILRRVILDDSFRPALEYLTKSFVGAEVNIRILENNAIAQKNVVDAINQQIKMQTSTLAINQQSVANAVTGLADSQQQQGIFNTVKRIFDPIGITGEADTGAVTAAESMVDYAKETLDRAEREKARLLAQLEVAISALQAAIDRFSSAVKEHYDRVAEIDRLRIHVKENILYYMQAIWNHEPPDQRFFRLYNIDVPVFEPQAGGTPVNIFPAGKGNGGSKLSKNLDQLMDLFEGKETWLAELPMPDFAMKTKKLVEVAELDTVLGYKGNYMIFALKENNYITLHMLQDYLLVGDDLEIQDPDAFANYTVDELKELAACAYRKDPDTFRKYRKEFKQLLVDKLMSSRKDNELVIVPTSSLYIECLVGTHPLLEDFKLIHRALDVKKVQAEVRHAELENIRLASRALKGKDEDPDIEKKIVIETHDRNIIVPADGN